MTPRLPWPLPARVRDVPPVTVAAPYPPERPMRVNPPPPCEVLSTATAPDATAYPWGARTGRPGQEWTAAEAAVLLALAAAGGDLTAHRTVHLEDR